jgi:hypothetical protein
VEAQFSADDSAFTVVVVVPHSPMNFSDSTVRPPWMQASYFLLHPQYSEYFPDPLCQMTPQSPPHLIAEQSGSAVVVVVGSAVVVVVGSLVVVVVGSLDVVVVGTSVVVVVGTSVVVVVATIVVVVVAAAVVVVVGSKVVVVVMRTQYSQK